jgi:polysaccharide biosynthesis protein PslJ
MNPHRISWTLTNQPFAQLIALAMLSSLLIARNEKKEIPAHADHGHARPVLGLDAVDHDLQHLPHWAWEQWDKVWKIMLTTFVAIMVLNSKERIIALTAVAA